MVSGLTLRLRAAALLAAGLALNLSPLSAASPMGHLSPKPASHEVASPGNAPARIFLSPDGQTVYVIGAIMDDSFLRFDELLLSSPEIKTVYLDSPGGLTLEGRLISALVRKRKLNTYVEHYCASACTQVFVAGRERILGPEGELGFHQAVGLDPAGETSKLAPPTTRQLSPTTVFGINGNDTLQLAYEQAGIDRPFIAQALARGHDDMWLPTRAGLRQAHVVTRQAGQSELPLPPGSLSHAEVRALIQTRPLWHAAQAAVPAGFAAGINDIWRRANSGSEIEAAINSGRAAVVLAAWPQLATASEPILDRMLLLYARAARSQRLRDYPLCKESGEESAAAIDPLDQEFERNEDLLLNELFSSSVRVPAPSITEANRIFEHEVMPQLATDLLVSGAKSTSAGCRLGFKIFEAIDQLPSQKRIKTYRALMSLPEMTGG